MRKILIVVDIQNDFVSGALGTPEAQAIVPNVVEKIKTYSEYDIIYTKDTHYPYYLQTLEGKKLPIEHCIEGSHGWELIPELGDPFACVCKNTFGFDGWAEHFEYIMKKEHYEVEFEIIGLCSDICVISNALILRALYPNNKITVDASCCAGVTPEKHSAALEVMKSCQIDVINE